MYSRRSHVVKMLTELVTFGLPVIKDLAQLGTELVTFGLPVIKDLAQLAVPATGCCIL